MNPNLRTNCQTTGAPTVPPSAAQEWQRSVLSSSRVPRRSPKSLPFRHRPRLQDWPYQHRRPTGTSTWHSMVQPLLKQPSSPATFPDARRLTRTGHRPTTIATLQTPAAPLAASKFYLSDEGESRQVHGSEIERLEWMLENLKVKTGYKECNGPSAHYTAAGDEDTSDDQHPVKALAVKPCALLAILSALQPNNQKI